MLTQNGCIRPLAVLAATAWMTSLSAAQKLILNIAVSEDMLHTAFWEGIVHLDVAEATK